MSPSLLRDVALVDRTQATQRMEAADAVERIQRPIHRRIDRVADRVFAAAGRSEFSLTVDAQVGVNAFAPMGFDTRNVFTSGVA